MEAETVAHRLMGNWSPLTHTWEEIMESEIGDFSGLPYPFFLAYALTEPQMPAIEKAVREWYAEWKWDGIRGQLIKRNGQVFLWSRGEELISNQFPELTSAAMQQLPDGTVLDGEIVVMQNGYVASFNVLQTRLNRKKITDKVCRESPATFIVYDIPEFDGKDIRPSPLVERRTLLQTLFESLTPPFYLAPQWTASSFAELATLRENARESGAEGLMLKHKNSPYLSGRKSGYWWKWKVEPLTLDAVLIYAQAGHGRRANLYTDFTFALWDKDKLVPFAKAYSGLTDAELLKLDKWIKQHTIERFGPVRSVSAELVFELAFEGVQKSSRHKCGYAVRFPRILRWRSDKPATEANLLEDLAELVEVEPTSGKSPIFD
jgi:DNA ligase 1